MSHAKRNFNSGNAKMEEMISDLERAHENFGNYRLILLPINID